LDDHNQKISHLKALYFLACADRVFTKSEAVYIKQVAKRLGISEAELEAFDDQEPELDLPDREYKVYALFHRLVIVTMIDDVLHPDEKKYCFDLGVKMGLHPNAVLEIITYVERNTVFDSTPDEIMDIFRKYLS
jgi:DnaJ-domain-containing protein 1